MRDRRYLAGARNAIARKNGNGGYPFCTRPTCETKASKCNIIAIHLTVSFQLAEKGLQVIELSGQLAIMIFVIYSHWEKENFSGE